MLMSKKTVDPSELRDLMSAFPEFQENVAARRGLRMKSRHEPLNQQYRERPETATITDGAKTTSQSVPTDDPIHTEVSFGTHNPISLPVGIHQAVGGDCDFPNPGDVLCGAIAGCLDSTIRIMANRVGLKIKTLSVDVKAKVDVRGTLRVKRDVPVGFQAFDINVTLKPKGFVPGKMLDKLIRAAEEGCVVLQTLKNTPTIDINRA